MQYFVMCELSTYLRNEWKCERDCQGSGADTMRGGECSLPLLGLEARPESVCLEIELVGRLHFARNLHSFMQNIPKNASLPFPALALSFKTTNK